MDKEIEAGNGYTRDLTHFTREILSDLAVSLFPEGECCLKRRVRPPGEPASGFVIMNDLLEETYVVYGHVRQSPSFRKTYDSLGDLIDDGWVLD